MVLMQGEFEEVLAHGRTGLGNSFIALLADWMRRVVASTMKFGHEVVWFVDLDSLWMRRASPPTF